MRTPSPARGGLCSGNRGWKASDGEKPFGIDQAANDHILAALKEHPEVFARCASEFPYFPAMQVMLLLDSRGEIRKNTGNQSGI